MIELLCPRYLVPVRPRGCVLEGHCVAIDTQSGRILDLLEQPAGTQRYPDARVVALDSHALMPGLINMHTHTPMSLLRGYADDLLLDTWLREHIWPAEARWADKAFVSLGTELAVAEMIRGGTTCFNDCYFFPDAIAAVVESTGTRACVGFPVIQVETQWAREPREYLDKGLALVAEHAGQPLLDFALAPHSMYTLDEDMLAEVSRVSGENGLRVHLHLLETGFEVEHALAHHGARPLQFADRLGLLSDRLIAVHMAHLEGGDIGLLAERGVHVVHCPQSNLKLASGTCRVSDLVSGGVNVCVGTDGAASNNDLDLLDELRTAALMAKGVSGDPCSMDAVTALDLVTVNAAKALGIEDRVGSIEAGREADLCAVNLASVRTQPVHDVISQLVYAAAASQVSDVWVRGRRLLAGGELQTLDEARLLERVDDWSQRVAHGRPRSSRVAV